MSMCNFVFREGLPLGQCFGRMSGILSYIVVGMKLRSTTSDRSDFSLAILLPKNSKPEGALK